MALTDDQRAMLRLLAQREQGYGDIAALTGQSVEQVREKVRGAVAALDSSGAPADDQRAMLRLLAQREDGYGDIAALTGQSVEQVREKVGLALAGLGGEPAPEKRPDPEPTPAPEKKPTAKKPAPPKPKRKLPDDRGAVWGVGAGLAVILLVVILLATGVLGGDDSDSSSSGSSAESGGSGEASGKGLKPTEAVLEPVDGGDASGQALFAKVNKKIVVVVRAKGLEAAPKGKAYTISLSKSPTERLPLIAAQVDKAGEINGTIPIAPQVLGFLASGFDEMEISLVSAGELSIALKVARQEKKVPNYSGEPILQGPVTGAIVEAGEAKE